MKRKNIMFFTLIILLILITVISFNIVNNSNIVNAKTGERTKVVQTETNQEKAIKFPSIDDVKIAKIQEKHVGPIDNMNPINVFYFDLNKPEQRSIVTNIINWLNSSSNSMSETDEEKIYWKGGASPTYLDIEFNNGKSLKIRTEASKIIINNYHKDISLITEKCPELVQFINSDWEKISRDMAKSNKQSTLENSTLNSIDDLIRTLKAKGHTAEVLTESVTQPFFTVSPKLIKIDEAVIQIFEYKDKKNVELDAKTITKQGDIIRDSTRTFINWIEKPNFYKKDNLIVLYVGKNETTLNILVDILGDSITE
jgi:uncharacterized protein YqfB (UPF0267 family)